MKKNTLILLLAALFAGGMALAVDPHDGGGAGGRDGFGRDGFDRDGGDGGFSRPPGDFSSGYTSHKWRQLGIHNAPRGIPNRAQILNLDRERSTVALPGQGPDGKPFGATLLAPRDMSSRTIRGQMGAIAHDTAFSDQLSRLKVTERTAGQYYWHTYNGLNYCHYYDRWGHHWWGWYRGGGFFWTRFFWGYWWWYDPFFFRWCYWLDGWWWWQDPYGVTYVYEDGQYVPGGAEAPSPQAYAEYPSQDAKRMVKVAGGDAFLYDTSGQGAFKPVYLASEVKEVEFSKTGNGKPLQILVIHNDNSFELFDDQGKALESEGGQ